MTTGGWIFIILSWGAILTLLIYCYTKILSHDAKKRDNDKEAELYPKAD
jgi:hypothetical protein